jgi:hypothetical protein
MLLTRGLRLATSLPSFARFTIRSVSPVVRTTSLPSRYTKVVWQEQPYLIYLLIDH